MSNKYKHGDHMPTDVIAARLVELSDAVREGRDAVQREFTMRIPAELDRDADLVLSEAARRLRGLSQPAGGVPEGDAKDMVERLRRWVRPSTQPEYLPGGVDHKAVDDIAAAADLIVALSSSSAPVVPEGLEVAARWVESRREPASEVPESRNIRKVERTSDQSVTVTLASCRAASAFERAITPGEDKP